MKERIRLGLGLSKAEGLRLDRCIRKSLRDGVRKRLRDGGVSESAKADTATEKTAPLDFFLLKRAMEVATVAAQSVGGLDEDLAANLAGECYGVFEQQLARKGIRYARGIPVAVRPG